MYFMICISDAAIILGFPLHLFFNTSAPRTISLHYYRIILAD